MSPPLTTTLAPSPPTPYVTSRTVQYRAIVPVGPVRSSSPFWVVAVGSKCSWVCSAALGCISADPLPCCGRWDSWLQLKIAARLHQGSHGAVQRWEWTDCIPSIRQYQTSKSTPLLLTPFCWYGSAVLSCIRTYSRSRIPWTVRGRPRDACFWLHHCPLGKFWGATLFRWACKGQSTRWSQVTPSNFWVYRWTCGNWVQVHEWSRMSTTPPLFPIPFRTNLWYAPLLPNSCKWVPSRSYTPTPGKYYP